MVRLDNHKIAGYASGRRWESCAHNQQIRPDVPRGTSGLFHFGSPLNSLTKPNNAGRGFFVGADPKTPRREWRVTAPAAALSSFYRCKAAPYQRDAVPTKGSKCSDP